MLAYGYPKRLRLDSYSFYLHPIPFVTALSSLNFFVESETRPVYFPTVILTYAMIID